MDKQTSKSEQVGEETGKQRLVKETAITTDKVQNVTSLLSVTKLVVANEFPRLS